MKSGNKTMDKLLGTSKKIQKLDIDLFDDKYQEQYEKYRKDYILREINNGMSRKRAEDLFDVEHPQGYTNYIAKQVRLNAVGEQRIVNKINEIIDWINQYE